MLGRILCERKETKKASEEKKASKKKKINRQPETCETAIGFALDCCGAIDSDVESRQDVPPHNPLKHKAACGGRRLYLCT